MKTKLYTSILATVLATLAMSASAAVTSWPIAADWDPILFNGGYYYDDAHDVLNNGADDNMLDIVGDATTYPAAFMLKRTEGTEEQLLFRIRLDDFKKTNKTKAWQILLDTDGVAGFDFALEVSAKLNNNQTTQWLVAPTVRFAAIAANGTSTDLQMASTNIWTATSGDDYANWAGAASSAINSSTDHFIDLAMPASEFWAATGLATNQPFGVAASSSQTPGQLDGDVGIQTGPLPSTPVDLTNTVSDTEGYISGASPATGGQLGGFQITISGSDLGDGTLADLLSITLNGVQVTSIDSASSTQIVVTVAASVATGLGDIVINTTSKGTITQVDGFTYEYEVPVYDLTVASPYGVTIPVSGTHSFDEGTVTNLSVSSPVDNGTTQYVCTGWTLAGQEPASGTGSSFALTVTNNAALTWTWGTNYWVEALAGADGSIASPGWIAAGTTIDIIPNADTYYEFAGWTGDASGTDNPLQLLVDGPKSVTATYTETLTANTGTPHWWLAQIDPNYTNDFEAAATDNFEGDDFSNWEEYVAGFNPTQMNSRNIMEIIEDASGQRTMSWPGDPDRRYTILWGTDIIGGGITNILVENFVPPAAGSVSYTNSAPTIDRTVFYRLIVTLP